MARVDQFRFEQRQIDIRRAFRRAGFAGETVAQRRFQFRVRNGSSPSTRSSSAARIAFARPRVDMYSSPVARKVGHIVGASLRQPPQPLHCSRLPMKGMVLGGERQHRREGQLDWSPELSRRSWSILKRPSPIIFPGLKRFFGSKERLISRITSSNSADLLGHVFRARDADAMLGGERSFELPDERRDFIRDLPILFQVSRACADRAPAARAAARWRHDRSNKPPGRAVA